MKSESDQPLPLCVPRQQTALEGDCVFCCQPALLFFLALHVQ